VVAAPLTGPPHGPPSRAPLTGRGALRVLLRPTRRGDVLLPGFLGDWWQIGVQSVRSLPSRVGSDPSRQGRGSLPRPWRDGSDPTREGSARNCLVPAREGDNSYASRILRTPFLKIRIFSPPYIRGEKIFEFSLGPISPRRGVPVRGSLITL